MSHSDLKSISNRAWRYRQAIAEDLGSGDITSEPIFPNRHRSRAVVVAKARGVIAGLDAARRICKMVDPRLRFVALLKNGSPVRRGAPVLRLEGRTVSILKAERTLLNFLQHLSGIASLTACFVDAVKGTRARILDTRKTTPLWRDLEKAAVRVGGGSNHRMGLYDAVLIKDNHIDAAGGIKSAVNAIRRNLHERIFVEVETRTMAEVKEAFESRIDRIMLDNMTPAQMKRAVAWLKAQKPPRPETEASGGIHLAMVKRIALTGVDFISIGALTHSAPILDLSLRIER